MKICEQYHKELQDRLDQESPDEDDPASFKLDPEPIPESAEEHIDPVLSIFKQ